MIQMVMQWTDIFLSARVCRIAAKVIFYAYIHTYIHKILMEIIALDGN